MTDAEQLKLKETITNKVCEYLDTHIGDVLRAAGKTDDDITEELMKVKKGVESTTCQAICEELHAGNQAAIAECKGKCSPV